MPFLCDFLGVDSLLNALSYMNAVTLARIACTSRMGTVAAHEAQQRPSLLVLKGSLDTVAKELREQLAARPTVVFLQYSLGQDDDEEEGEAAIADFVKKKLPPSAQVLGGHTMSLQCAWFPKDATRQKTTLDYRCKHDRCEVAILAATFPEAKAQAFHVPPATSRDSDSEDSYSEDEELEDISARAEHQESTSVAACEDDARKCGYPSQGECLRNSTREDEIRQLLNITPPPKVIVIHHADRTGHLISKMQAAYPEAAIIGGVVMGRRVLVSGAGQEPLAKKGIGALAISGNAPLFAMTCPFTGCASTAEKTVATCMKRAQDTATENGESILGALLFTCNARGPHVFGSHAKDASLFQEQFPQAPLMGFYAAGEIGPSVDEDSDHAFLRGNACLQGFTAVYGLFLVPSKRIPSIAFQRAMLHGEVLEAFKDTQQT
ncbi:unnamed protein product [Effrenium voratum]|nr:unnamed protein product [Effrenium voratum]CAJ1462012.1 unnamed protein product [Effrenium voratum]